MMTHAEAKAFAGYMNDDVRKLSRLRKTDLQEIRRAELLAEGVVWESGGPRTKDDLVNDILNRRYPLARVNEATHVLYHAPSARWSACEHCDTKPATENVNTSELRPGDVVLEHGMRIRIDEVREYTPHGAIGERAWCCPGTVLNVTEVTSQHVIPAAFLETYGYSEEAGGFVAERHDAWTVQGDTRARWTVEMPRPAAVTPRPVPPQPPMSDDMAGRYLHYLADRQADR